MSPPAPGGASENRLLPPESRGSSSPPTRGEARDAAERGILVPVRFEGARLPIDVRAIQTTDLDKWGGGDPASAPFQDLLRSLGAIIKRQRATQSLMSGAGSAPSASAVTVPRVAICVLPFANMSGDQEQEYFSDGITEDIITDLSKVSALLHDFL